MNRTTEDIDQDQRARENSARMQSQAPLDARSTIGQGQVARGIALADKVNDIFTYHAPDAGQQVTYERLRSGAKEFARLLLDCTPPCADQAAALRLLRECVMTANAAIALRGLV